MPRCGVLGNNAGGGPESRDRFSGKSGKSCHRPVSCRVLKYGFLLLNPSLKVFGRLVLDQATAAELLK